jgi:UMF1 family MFS transporter
MTTATAASSAPAPGKTALPGLTGWVLFDWATQPFYTLVTTFLFAPYFTAHFVGDARGASWWGYTMGAAAILVAIGSPLLGAVADASGRLKPYIAVIAGAFAISQALLWFAEPGALWRLWIVVPALIVATCCAEFATVLNNALMPRLVPLAQYGRLSGTGWAVGYVGGLVSLLVMVAFVLSDPGKPTMLGLEPLIANGPEREADRLVGPFCAVWFLIFVTPFFLFTPDAPARAKTVRPGFADAFRSLGQTLRNVRQYREIMLFLIAYLLFIDGLQAIFSFGGIYALNVFGWQSMQLALFGIILAVAGGVGAFAGGFLDDRLGSKKVILGALILLMIACLGIISIDRSHVLFAVEVAAPEEGRPLFSSSGEAVYIGFAILIGLAAGPLQSASRSFLARLAPAEHVTEFFGLQAFSGKASAFAAPLTIGLVNQLTGSLRLGMATILVFLVAGLAVMLALRAGGEARSSTAG